MSAVWYLMRGSGVVTLILLTAVVVLGIGTTNRARVGRLPRFVTLALHRNVSLLAVAFLVVHVVTAVVDTYGGIRLAQVFVPLPTHRYGLWLGLGALSLDLLAALIVTSLLRHRLSQRVWKRVHWLAYASWPFALLHSIGTGTDKHAGWFQLISFASMGLVGVTVLWRLAALRRPYPKYLGAGA
ncbi:MAG: ferric reductase-like transmembrane domain-containing protein [Gaiellaceae bacterium]